MSRHIGIAVPCMDLVDAWFCHDLARAMTYHAMTCPDDMISMTFHQGALIAESRNQLAKSSVEEGCDYVVFLDSDMRFPKDTFQRLMAWDEAVGSVIAANCAKRRRPISATARKERADDPDTLEAVWPEREKRGLERIHVAGAAIMSIHVEALMQLPYPWFNTPWLDEEQRFVGEDLYFCGLLKEHDVPLYIDHGLSWQIGHIGQYVYEMKDVLAEREMARQGLWDHIKPDQITGAGLQPVK